MKTLDYNPSKLEVQYAETLAGLSKDIESKIPGIKIFNVVNRIEEDNPIVRFYLNDSDGDPHELAVRIIQTPDQF